MKLMNDVVDIIKNNNNFVITAHHHPDGDAIGSSIGLYLALKKIGKNVDIVIDEVPKTFKYLVGYGDIKSDSDKIYDVGLILDNANIDRINKPNIVKNMKMKVVIDHHISNTLYADVNYVETLSSCSMVIYKLIKELGIEVDIDIGNAIYTGLLTDTGCYRNKNVNSDTFIVSSELSKIIDITKIIKLATGTISKSEFMLRKIGIENLEFYMNDRIVLTYVSDDDLKKCNATKNECSSLVNIPREIEGVEVSVLIRYFHDEIRVSLRSNNIDVNKVASNFGCGGHRFAAGIAFSPDENHLSIKNRIIESLESAIDEWDNSCK